MVKLSNVLLIFAILLAVLFVHKTNACSCMPVHPQTTYCNSEYVIIARVLRKSVRKINYNDVYKIDIKKSYKMTEKAKEFLKDGRIMTPSSESACGLQLKIGKLYLISANDQRIGICNYVKEYSKMTVVERRGFAGGYKKGCLCDIKISFNQHHSYAPVGSCIWNPFSKCESEYGACVQSRGLMTPEGKPVKCQWRNSSAYNACINEP